MSNLQTIIDALPQVWDWSVSHGMTLVTTSSYGELFLIGALAVTWAFILYWFFFVFLRGLIVDRYLRHIPEVPGRVPVFGHALLLMGGSPWKKMADWSLNSYSSTNDDKKKDAAPVNRLVRFSVFHQRVVYINDPVLLKRVLLTNQRNYMKDIAVSYKHFICLLGKGLVTSEGEKWKKGRLLLSHAMRIDILEEVPQLAMRAAGRIMDKLAALDAKTSFLDLNEEFRHMTLQVIGETALSLEPEEIDRIFPALYLPIVHECNRRVWEPWRTLMPFLEGYQERRRCLRELNAVLGDIIQKRWDDRHKPHKRDIMALCISQIKNMDAAMVLQLRDDVKTILLAGHETSAALLTWATYEVMCFPEVRDKIVEEARRLFDPARCEKSIVTPQGKTWGVPTASDVRSMLRWSPAALRETLRKHTVVPLVMRRAVKNDVWPAAMTGLDKDVTIPAGCTVAVGIQAVHYRPDIWPDPQAFKPERFLDMGFETGTGVQSNDVNQTPIDPYAFIPFINGPRNCLGQHLAIMETAVVLAYLFLNWDLRLYSGDVGAGDVEKRALQDKVGRPHEFMVPIVPHDGLRVVGTLCKM
ncbi:cytochrome p450-like protein [Trypanosoma rangeli]|uniref:Cytochrome p450-like protein n=1 Tax=Trypanosoma rangeli TaxID=5698 RepID=A0A422N4L6_TRYRA|nr:cytochrome p450-like protein [Trypanosoma rangeli]RNF00433.1 cytochrome p450-like protein [Trypanosoma rangeli]|eukprot:RNF00433.1 cytochrome p450-like protein [Trypanosoma rangeli]